MFRVLSLWIAVAVVFGGLSSTAGAAGYAVIVNSANATESLDRKLVKKYYLKQKKSWKGGDKVDSVDIKGASQARDAFLEDVLRMSSDELKRYWIKQQYQEAVKPAQQVQTEGDAISYVETTESAIAFVPASAASSSNVKVVFNY